MRVDIRAAFLVALACGLFIHGPAWAQSDSRGLVDRLDRLERDLSTLQGQVYRGGGASTVITSPAAGGGGGGLSGDSYSMLDQRISAIESEMRDLTGQLEKIGFTNSQLQTKLDRMQADNDFRFKELEQKAGIGGAGGAQPGQSGQVSPSQAPPSQAPPSQAPTSLTPPPAGQTQPKDWNPTMGSPPGVLGQVSPGDIKKAQAEAAAAAPPAAPSKAGQPVLPGKTPQEQYDYAFGLLKNSDFEGADAAFKTFIAQHPQDPLAGNAMYWQGQIPFSQGEYDQAMPLFMEAYKKYPKSAKAGESLLKAGLSFSNMNKKKEACLVILHFLTEFPDAGDSLKRQAHQEKQKLGC